MSTLECVRETLRLALEELEAYTAARPADWPLWWERYVETKLDYRATEETFAQKLIQAGTDGAAVLAWAQQTADASHGPQLVLLQRVWAETFELAAEKMAVRADVPVGAVKNPHEPDAQWAAKRGQSPNKRTEWTGYKVQVGRVQI